MIDLLKFSPYTYGSRSRDYQAIARAENGVYNFAKMSTDSMANSMLYENTDDRLLELLAKTLGFEAKHNYSAPTLRGICSAFKTICKHKGTKTSIEEAVRVLLRSQNLDIDYYVEVNQENREIEIFLAYPDSDTINLTVIDDILEYILPVGYVYVIYTSGVNRKFATEEIIVSNKADKEMVSDFELDKVTYSEDINEIKPYVGQDSVYGYNSKQNPSDNS